MMMRAAICLIPLALFTFASPAMAWWPFGNKAEEKPVVQTAPPISDEQLAAIPGDRRMQYEGECLAKAIDRAKEMDADQASFLATNRDYIHQCIYKRAQKDGVVSAPVAP